jgi:LemA protein
MWVLVIAGGLVLLAILVVAVLFNGFVRHRAMVGEAWSGIDVQLKRRHDLIPNLVTLVKGYAQHEHQVFTEVTRLRGQARELARDDQPARESAENAFTGQVKQLLVLAEDYPNLKADGNFRDLQRQLVEVEETLQYARRYYNGTVRDYNVAIGSFPGVLLAAPLGFKPAVFFELETATERLAPAVEMNA